MIITDIKKVKLMKVALVFFSPSGQVFAIEKIKGKNIHFEYLKILTKSNSQFKNVLKKLVTSKINWDNWYNNPFDFVEKVVPLFTKEGYVVYMNLTPNNIMETNSALILLPQNLSSALEKLFMNNEKIFENIYFYDIAIYNCYTNDFESTITEIPDVPNSFQLFEVITSECKKKTKLK